MPENKRQFETDCFPPHWSRPLWGISKAPFTRYNLLLNRLSNRFDNRVNVCIHDTTGCQTRCQTGCTTRFDNRIDNRLYRVNGVLMTGVSETIQTVNVAVAGQWTTLSTSAPLQGGLQGLDTYCSSYCNRLGPSFGSVARIWCEGAQKLHETFFVAHKMTRNNTLNKAHVAETELPQLLSQNTKFMFGEATAQSRCQT